MKARALGRNAEKPRPCGLFRDWANTSSALVDRVRSHAILAVAESTDAADRLAPRILLLQLHTGADVGPKAER